MVQAKLILASRSPRRARLLSDAGFAFDQIDPPFDDAAQPQDQGAGAVDLATQLAATKAMSAVHSLENGAKAIVVGADTICIGSDGQLIGQPADRRSAREMIEAFMNQTHAVVSGVALIALAGDDESPAGSVSEYLAKNGLHGEVFADSAEVCFGALSDEEIDSYLDNGEWRGKAGGYNLFDRQDAGWPVTVADGSDPTTVVGLPMRKLVPALRRWSILPVTGIAETSRRA